MQHEPVFLLSPWAEPASRWHHGAMWCLTSAVVWALTLPMDWSHLGSIESTPRAVRPASEVQGDLQDVSDESLRKIWSALPKEDQKEISAWYRAECDRRRTLARQLERHVFHSLKEARGKWGILEPASVYNGAKHAPAQPIMRTMLAPQDPKVLAERKRMGLTQVNPAPAWVYDWGTGMVQQSEQPFAPDHLFELALAGRAPEQDLAIALIEQALDLGTLRPIHKAFGHTYASRTGTAYSGISLYDAWGSGVKIEMPDVECLGILHDVEDDWRSFSAPVPGGQQARLYKRIGKMFHSIRRERGLAQALASSYFNADPRLDPTYSSATDRLQLFWTKHDSALDVSRAALPASSDWDAWWESLALLQTDEDLLERAAQRRMSLRTEGVRLRGIMVWVLREWGALKDK